MPRKPLTSEQKDRIRRGLIRSAVARACRACGKQNATKRTTSPDGAVSVRRCRYCGHEQSTDLTTLGTAPGHESGGSEP